MWNIILQQFCFERCSEWIENMVKAPSSGLQKSLRTVKVKQEQEESKESQEAQEAQQWEESGLKESQASQEKKKKVVQVVGQSGMLRGNRMLWSYKKPRTRARKVQAE